MAQNQCYYIYDFSNFGTELLRIFYSIVAKKFNKCSGAGKLGLSNTGVKPVLENDIRIKST